jgi:hypothetical protein
VLQPIALHDLARGIGATVCAEVLASVVHPDVLAHDAPALLNLNTTAAGDAVMGPPAEAAIQEALRRPGGTR